MTEQNNVEPQTGAPVISTIRALRLPLDDRFYSLDGDQLAFFRLHTGIEDEGELKKHILEVQAKAYNVCAIKLQHLTLTHRGKTLLERFLDTLAFVYFFS